MFLFYLQLQIKCIQCAINLLSGFIWCYWPDLRTGLSYELNKNCWIHNYIGINLKKEYYIYIITKNKNNSSKDGESMHADIIECVDYGKNVWIYRH